MKQFYVELKKADPTKDYSQLNAYVDGQPAKGRFRDDLYIAPKEFFQCAQQFRNHLEPFLHPGDHCVVFEVVGYADRADDIPEPAP